MSTCHPKSLYLLFKQYYGHLYFITRAFQHTIRHLKASNTLTWHNVQWKWLTRASVSTCACNCGSIAWDSCTKAQRWNQSSNFGFCHSSQFLLWSLPWSGDLCSAWSSPQTNALFPQKRAVPWAVPWAVHVKVTSSMGQAFLPEVLGQSELI